MDFAEIPVTYPDGQINVVKPPQSLLNNGFIPKQDGVRGQPLPAQYLNWLFREAFRNAGNDAVGDGSGVDIMVGTAEGLVTLYAIDSVTPANYIHAVGYKSASNAPVFNVIDSNVLTIGAMTATSIAISGGAANDIVLRVSVRG